MSARRYLRPSLPPALPAIAATTPVAMAGNLQGRTDQGKAGHVTMPPVLLPTHNLCKLVRTCILLGLVCIEALSPGQRSLATLHHRPLRAQISAALDLEEIMGERRQKSSSQQLPVLLDSFLDFPNFPSAVDVNFPIVSLLRCSRLCE